MRSGEMPRVVGSAGLVMALVLSACAGDAGSVPTGSEVATPGRAPVVSAVAPGDVMETTIEELIAPVGPVDVRRVDLSVRTGSSGMTVRADFRATARETIDSLELDYCGPPMTFFSVDGSTVDAVVEDSNLRAPLHSPLPADADFEFRFLTVVPSGEMPPEDPAQVATELLCR